MSDASFLHTYLGLFQSLLSTKMPGQLSLVFIGRSTSTASPVMIDGESKIGISIHSDNVSHRRKYGRQM